MERSRFYIMKTKFLFLILLSVFVISSCSAVKNNDSLETKEKIQTQKLSQVQVIGTGIGQMPPDFSVVSSDGKSIVLSRLLEEKKPVIVYFMATWCPYCAEDYETLSKIYKDYENEVIFVSIDLDLNENVLDLAQYKKKYPNLHGMPFAEVNERVLADYGVTKTTTKYAIARNGTILYKTIGAFDEEGWKILLDALIRT